jgi:serine/threonine protein kinase
MFSEHRAAHLARGIRLGPYEIGPVGAGGMGEVYRAVDTRLERTVAIKLLSQRFADWPDMRARFDREATAVASLNHPHTAHCWTSDGNQARTSSCSFDERWIAYTSDETGSWEVYIRPVSGEGRGFKSRRVVACSRTGGKTDRNSST